MSVPQADFAAVTPWKGIQNKPNFFPTLPSLIGREGATDGQFMVWSQVRARWEPSSYAPGSVAWGQIGGLLANQLDLQAALDLKANIADLALVAFTGNYYDLSNLPTGTGGGTVTSVTAGTGLSATPNPITNAGTIDHQNYGTSGSYHKVATNAQGHVTAGYNDANVVNIEEYGADPTGATNSDAAISAALAALPVGGPLQRIWVDNTGSGYTSAPTVNISGGGGGTATAVIDNGLVVGIYITANGNYGSNPTISFSGGGGGSGATAYAIVGTPCRLELPPGLFQTTGILLPASVSCLEIAGKGAVLWCTNPSNTCIAYNDSNNLTQIHGLTLRHDFNPAKWGNNVPSRDTGCGIRLKGRFQHLYNLNIFQSPEFGINVGDDPGAPLPCRFVTISNVICEDTCGDGIHFQFAQDGLCTGCIVRRSGDDAFAAVCDSGGLQYTQRIKFESCIAEQPYGCALRFESCLDCDAIGHMVLGSRQAGITIASQAGGACQNINLISCTVRNPNAFDPTAIVGRGIASELGAAGIIDTLRIVSCNISDTQTTNGQGIFLSASGGSVIKNVMICGNNFSNIAAANYIFTAGLTVATVVRNNTSLDPTKSYLDAGSAPAPVAVNNT